MTYRIDKIKQIMVESLLPDNQPENNCVPVKDKIIMSAAMGIFYGGAAGLIWGLEVGIEVGIGLAIVTGGFVYGIESCNRAIEFAEQGRKVRAYLKALQSTLEFAVGLTGAGAIAGFSIAGPEGAIWGAATGALIGLGGFGLINMDSLSTAFRQRHQRLTSPIVPFI